MMDGGEEEKFEYSEHDEQFYKDNQPQCFADGHVSEAVAVETVYPIYSVHTVSYVANITIIF